MSDSYIRRKEKQNRYQLLNINLAILSFKFQQIDMKWDLARLILDGMEGTGQCLILTFEEKKNRIVISYST